MPNALRLIPCLLCVVLACAIQSGRAQDFPSKPIRIIVPNAPGVTPDILLRIITPDMSRFIGQPVVVENKAGADGVIAYEYVAKQVPADGYTVMLGSISQLAILPWTAKDLRFNPLKDLVNVVGLAKSRYVFASSSKLPWKTFNEVAAYAKANPDKMNYGSSGPTTRFVTEAVIRHLGIRIVYVPYRAGAAYQLGLVGNDVQVGMLSESSAIAQGNKVQPLAITGEQRSPAFANIPTFKEMGIPGIPGTSYELSVPVETPKPIIARLYAAALQSLQQVEMGVRLEKIGLNVIAESPEAAAARFAEEAKLFGDIAKAIGIKPE